jgi:hypothetical protein
MEAVDDASGESGKTGPLLYFQMKLKFGFDDLQ